MPYVIQRVTDGQWKTGKSFSVDLSKATVYKTLADAETDLNALPRYVVKVCRALEIDKDGNLNIANGIILKRTNHEM